MNKILITLLLAFAGCMNTLAQGQKISGKVIDHEGLEVIGASVTIKGVSGVGTITDLDGKFTIQVNNPAKDVLVFSFIGLKTQEVKINNRSVINVTMKADAVMLEEVVAIGYATVKQKDLTGSVTSVKSEDLMKVPTSDVSQALAGRMAGVQVKQNDGEPGSSISIRVRGGISITQSNEPLYIIDGFPTEDGMASLDPAEIESIDILKDASATAIYGARGANGVVVITTKSGSQDEGKATVSFDTYIGVRKLAKKLDMLSTEEFVIADYERTLGHASKEEDMLSWQNRYGGFIDIHENYARRKGLDWQEETLGRTTLTQNYRVGVNGGNKSTKYSASYSYYDDEGAMVHSGSSKHNISLSLNSEINKKLSFTARASFDQRKIEGAGTAGNGSGVDTNARFNKMAQILQQRPIIGLKGSDEDLLNGNDPLYDEEGNVLVNPLMNAREEKIVREYRNLQINGGFTWKLLKHLTFRNTTGMRYQINRNASAYGDESLMGKRTSIYGLIRDTESGSFQTSNVLTYNFKKNKHRVTTMVGQEYISRWTRWMEASATHFPNDDIILEDMGLGTPGTVKSNENYDDILLSFFARANYDLADKYLFTATIRADGSSKFGDHNKWGYFPAVSAAWRMSEEAFIKKLNIFSDLKLRMGYGLAGNNRIGSYQSLALLGSVLTAVGNTHTPGYAPKQISNQNLKWEANKTFNLGLDIGFLNQRITISPEFYVNKSSNLLLNAKLPESSGYANMIINAGATKNIGVDLTVNTVNIAHKNWEWKTQLTFSHNKNTVEELTGESVQLYEAKFGFNQNTHRIAVGESLGQFYGYVTEGLYQVSDFDYNPQTKKYTLKKGIPYHGNRNNIKPGMWKFKNVDNSNEIIDENDKQVIGNATPIFYGGLNNTFSYKNFDLSIFLTYSYGNEVLNATKMITGRAGLSNKNALDVTNSHNRWMTINERGQIVTDPEELTALNAGKTVAAYYDAEEGSYYVHSWGVEDASFLKLSNITLGYNFPTKKIRKIGLSKLRLYFTGNNLATWTRYSGYDPEVSTMSSALTPGVDYGGYPRSRSYVFGINVAF